MATKTPVVIVHGIDHWPAFGERRWSTAYFKEVSGYRTIPVEIGARYTDDSWSQSLMTQSLYQNSSTSMLTRLKELNQRDTWLNIHIESSTISTEDAVSNDVQDATREIILKIESLQHLIEKVDRTTRDMNKWVRSDDWSNRAMSPKKHDPTSGVEKGNDQLVGKQDDHVDLASGEIHVLECADDLQKPSYAKILESSDAQDKPVDCERASENERWVLVDKLKKRNIKLEGNRLMIRLWVSG